MAQNPTRLAAATVTTGAAAAVCTVAAGKTAIVKQIQFVNRTAGAVTVTVTLNGTWYLANSLSLAANSVVTLDLSLVLNAGDVIAANSNTTNGADLLISGVVSP